MILGSVLQLPNFLNHGKRNLVVLLGLLPWKVMSRKTIVWSSVNLWFLIGKPMVHFSA
ncbi:rCG46357 [Rattus norvegicus]|uniref:RCG46357 n=1 Tax=Rattus norvegicus TaxID=10116 RepID=A6ICZ6_RAT|nr:rCG46357 [Rattus norvegicus]